MTTQSTGNDQGHEGRSALVRPLRPFAPFVILVVAYAVLAVGFSVATPVFEAPDEVHHVSYIHFLATQHRLPVLRAGEPSEYHQAPLYYAIGAALTGWVPAGDFDFVATQRNPFWAYRDWEIGRDNKNRFLHGPWEAWPWRGTALMVHLVRLLSVLLGAGTLWVTYRIGLDLFGSKVAALGPLAFIAFNPMFLFISGSVTNDTLTMFVGALTIWTALRLLRAGPARRLVIQLGILLGLGWMTKITTVFLLPAVGLAILLSTRPWQGREGWHAFWRTTLIAFGLGLALGGWLFARNIALYGDPAALQQDLAVWGHRSLEKSLAVFDQDLRFIWTSTWGGFANGQVPLPPEFSAVMGVVAGLSLFGLLRVAVTRRENLSPLAILSIAVLGLATALIYYTLTSRDGRYGRYAFAALSAGVVLLFWGLSGLVPRRWVGALAVVCDLAMAAAATVALLVYLVPVYGPPPKLDPARLAVLPGRVDVTLGGFARLAAAQVEPSAVTPGGRVAVSLTWASLAPTPGNYVVFVHLLDSEGVIVAQRDTYPGLGQFPTSFWQPGDAFTDCIVVPIPETVYRPDVAQVQVGLYDYDSGWRLPVQGADGRVLGDAVTVGEVDIAATPDPWPNAIHINFDNQIELAGYELAPRSLKPGQALDLTLYWRALGPIGHNYTVFAHLLGPGEMVWAVGDSRPQPPTTSWLALGQVIEDRHRLELPQDVPPGQYEIEVGLYRARTGERLDLIAPDGRRTLENRLLLTRVRVR